MVSYLYRLVFTALLTACISSCSTESASEENSTSEITFEQEQTVETLKDTSIFQELVESYEDPERGVWQNPELIIEKFGNLSGKTVADIGAGTGYFTFKLASQGAKVIAVDIDEQFLDYILERKQELVNLKGEVETRLSLADDPTLSNQEVDYVLIVNTYHFLEDRMSYLTKLKAGLKTDGQIIIVDFKGGKLPVGPLEEFKTDANSVKIELLSSGFSINEVDETSLKYQYIITAKK